MYTPLNDPELVKSYHQEYFRLINFYHNIKRPAFFIKYYNLESEIAPKEETLNAAFDRYTKTKNRWSIYELTPAFSVSAIQNTPNTVPDLKGQMLEGTSTLTVYTIPEPRVDDLISFYSPIESEELFRVANLRLQVNSLYTDPSIKWFELDLETAPIKEEHLGDLRKAYHYVYDLSLERNMKYKEYKSYISYLDTTHAIAEEIMEFFFPIWDLYQYEKQIPAITNELIYFFKSSFDVKSRRLYEDIKTPFGYWNTYDFKFNSLEEINFDNDIYDVYDLETREWTEYEWIRDSLTDPTKYEGIDKLLYLSEQLNNLIKQGY